MIFEWLIVLPSLSNIIILPRYLYEPGFEISIFVLIYGRQTYKLFHLHIWEKCLTWIKKIIGIRHPLPKGLISSNSLNNRIGIPSNNYICIFFYHRRCSCGAPWFNSNYFFIHCFS